MPQTSKPLNLSRYSQAEDLHALRPYCHGEVERLAELTTVCKEFYDPRGIFSPSLLLPKDIDD